MNAPSSRHFKSAADSSSGIVFSPDIFNLEFSRRAQAPSPRSSHARGRPVGGPSSKQPRVRAAEHSASNKKSSQASQRLSSVHPALRHRPDSGRAGDVGALDDLIAKNGGTTSTYEQLPHRLRISKQKPQITAGERIIELTRTNGYLLQELAYYKDTRAADLAFYGMMVDLHMAFKDALKERSQKRADAEHKLLNYWGINFGDGNVEDQVF